MVFSGKRHGERREFCLTENRYGPLSIHLEHPDWTPAFDILPDEAADSKKRIMDWIAEEQLQVVGQHFPPFPGLGHIVKKQGAWEWKPLRLQE